MLLTPTHRSSVYPDYPQQIPATIDPATLSFGQIQQLSQEELAELLTVHQPPFLHDDAYRRLPQMDVETLRKMVFLLCRCLQPSH